MNTRFLFLMLFLSTMVKAQILYFFPKKQYFYEGGKAKLYEELAKILKEQNYTPCEKDEGLMVKLLISPDKKVQYVSEEDTLSVKQNACAYKMIKSILPHLKSWKPAEINGQSVKAIARFLFIPNDLINGISYSNEKFKNAEYKGGIDKFRNSFYPCINIERFRWSSDFTINLYFEINTQGRIQFMHLSPEVDNDDFMRTIVTCINSRGKNWEPASYKGIKYVTPFRFPMNFKNPENQ